LILETGPTVGGKSLREHFEVINHRDAIHYVEDLAASPEPITPFHVRRFAWARPKSKRQPGFFGRFDGVINGSDHSLGLLFVIGYLLGGKNGSIHPVLGLGTAQRKLSAAFVVAAADPSSGHQSEHLGYALIPSLGIFK
jgi:hypothetical protein